MMQKIIYKIQYQFIQKQKWYDDPKFSHFYDYKTAKNELKECRKLYPKFRYRLTKVTVIEKYEILED